MHWYNILYQEGDKRKEEYGLLTLLLNGLYLVDPGSRINTPDPGSKNSNKQQVKKKFGTIHKEL